MLRRLLIPFIFLMIIGLGFISFKNKLYIKYILKKQPTVYRLIQKGKNLIAHNILRKIKNEKPKIKSKIVTISVDTDNVLEYYDKFWGGFGHDFFYSGITLPKNRAFFNLIKQINWERKAFTFYRSHNIFSDRDAPGGEQCGGKVYNEDANGKPVYNWDRVDKVFDIILKSNMKPIVELSFMPEALTSDPQRIGDWRKANVAPPKDFNKWKNLVYETVNHLQERYGAKEIESWYFEVWNEPDLWFHFWVPDTKDSSKTNLKKFYKLYDYTVAGAIAANSDIKIGGPAIAGWPYVLNGFLEHTTKGNNNVTGAKGCKIDFYSFHKYGDVEKAIIKYTKLYVDNALFIDKEKFYKTPFLLDEFGPSGTRWKQPWKNTPFVSAWICKIVDGMFELGSEKGSAYRPKCMIYWGAIGENYKGGSGALATILGKNAKNILKGPVFNTYEALSYLGKERISVDGTSFGDYVHGFATRHGEKSVEVVLYHIDKYIRNVPAIKDSVLINLEIKNLFFDKYFVRYFKIDETHSNAYSLWKRLGSPTNPTGGQLKMLQNNDDLKMAEPVNQVTINGGIFHKTINIEANSVSLIILSRISDKIPPLNPEKLIVKHVNYNSIDLEWSAPTAAKDNDRAESYQVYRNGSLVAKTFGTTLKEKNLIDDTGYSYKIYSVDKQGNLSSSPVRGFFKTNRDKTPPAITSFITNNSSSILICFSEPIDKLTSTIKNNFSINDNIDIKSVVLGSHGKCLKFTTTPHVQGIDYIIRMKDIKDRATTPNYLQTTEWKYKFIPSFTDFFEKNSIDQYNWKHNNSDSKSGYNRYDAKNENLIIVTGDNNGVAFSGTLPMSSHGAFSVSVLPYNKYPNGGVIEILLKADEDNYYLLKNTDGYGPGKIAKYVSGHLVDSVKFVHQFYQNKEYRIEIKFSPILTTVNAFGQKRILKKNRANIRIKEFKISLIQQDAIIDNIIYQAK